VAEPSSNTDEPRDRLDGEVFGECFEQFSQGIRSFLRSKLKNEADIDECFSRVFEKLWIHGTRVNPSARGAWLFVVARREAALHWRLKKRSEEILEGFAQESRQVTDDKSPDDRLLHDEKLESLRQAAEQLSPQQKEVLRRRFVDQSSFQEIAQELSVPLGTALSRMHSAIKKLRKVLNDEEMLD